MKPARLRGMAACGMVLPLASTLLQAQAPSTPRLPEAIPAAQARPGSPPPPVKFYTEATLHTNATFLAEGQPVGATLPPPPAMPDSVGTIPPGQPLFMVVDPTTGQPIAADPEIRFDLQFEGGTPAELVEAIEQAGVGTLNVIIPRDLADTEIPAMRVKHVTVPQLFEALTVASRKTVTWTYDSGFAPYAGPRQYQQKETSFGFRTQGQPSATSIWTFYAERPPVTTSPPPVPKVVRFYQLAPYLDQERYRVDDITTAIQTGWRMLGDEDPPTLNFHKDTKLLIALGTQSQLQMIEEVLSQLGPRGSAPSVGSVPSVRQPTAPRLVAPPEAVAPPAPAAVPPKP